MWNLRKFEDNSTYAHYLKSDDVWLPRVAYILNNHVEVLDPSTHRDEHEADLDWSTVSDDPSVTPNPSYGTGLARGGDNKRWVDFTELGHHFIELANNGTLYFKDIEEPSVGWYRASVSDGVVTISTPSGKTSYSDFTGILNFENYPKDIYAIGL